jgi:hypothetical protein
MLWRTPVSRDYRLPLAPAAIGSGGAYDVSVLRVQEIFRRLRTGNTALSQPGHISGVAEPLERQVHYTISYEITLEDM